MDYFADARNRRKQLEAQPDFVRQVLADGAAKARKKAADVLLRAQKACGVKP
jgi:tryptophanyl-tRNA synthetase